MLEIIAFFLQMLSELGSNFFKFFDDGSYLVVKDLVLGLQMALVLAYVVFGDKSEEFFLQCITRLNRSIVVVDYIICASLDQFFDSHKLITLDYAVILCFDDAFDTHQANFIVGIIGT